MNVFDFFRSIVLNDPDKIAEDERHTLDHVPVSPKIDKPVEEGGDVQVSPQLDPREKALLEAARKYGKPFKCASGLLQREVLAVPPDCYVVRAGQRK